MQQKEESCTTLGLPTNIVQPLPIPKINGIIISEVRTIRSHEILGLIYRRMDYHHQETLWNTLIYQDYQGP